jgi:hypothetical protein
MTLPEPLTALLRHRAGMGELAQAFPFLTVDQAGFPHVALLSTMELGVGADSTVHAVLAGTTTRANLLRTRQATLVAVEGTSAHTLKLALQRAVDVEGLLGAVFTVASHKADSLGIDLTPIGFRPTDELALLERWDRSARVLASLSGPRAS